MSTYTYSITEDTANSKINSPKLSTDIQNSSIVPSLEAINTNEDSISIVFDSSLSTSEETILTGLISSHDGEPLPVISSPQIVQIDKLEPVRTFALAEGSSMRARLLNIYNETINKNSTTNLDWKIPNIAYQGVNKKSYMDGINYYAKNAEVGDHMTFEVIDKDNVLGYGANVVLDQFGYQWAVMPNQEVNIRLYKARLIPDLYIRIVYTSVGTVDDIKFVCNLYRHVDISENV